ncbi:DUF2180 family protein [Streptomyces sp. F001]|uniref:DUF2180 family protein n=1 Tax=Streptomyces sp. F001 TaxID=1510026 RepID=UPI00101E465A|nr:DUF2180 family protein [Streptomyces sp. F001]RZB15351.1 DUF2180 family protein [Streptomyces sp. F001]
MNCFDCLALERVSTAVAICRSCGAALCSERVQNETKTITQLVGMGKATHEPAARELLCGVCSRAVHEG